MNKFLVKLLFFSITIVVLTVIKFVTQKVVVGIFVKKERKKPQKGKRLQHFEKLIIGAINFAYVTVLILLILDFTGLNSIITALITFAGVGSLVVGLAAQDIFKDIIAGFLLISEDNIAHDDYVSINGFEGTVEDIKLRNIYLRSYSGQLITVPSGQVEMIVNYSRGDAKAICHVNIPSFEQIEDVKAAVERAGIQVKECYTQAHSVAVIDGVTEILNNCYRMRAYIKTNGTDYFYMQRKFNEAILEQLKESGITVIVEDSHNVKIIEGE